MIDRSTGAACALALALAALLFAAPPAQAAAPAPYVKAWMPEQTDSLRARAARALGAFEGNTGDSVGGDNYIAYDRVGRITRDLLRELGRARMNQALALEPALRDLGLKVEFRLDPAQPGFGLLMVRNPFRVSAAAVGFLYWWLGDDLRYQGTYFRRGFDPQFRVWWMGHGESPYLCAIAERTSVPGEAAGLLVLRMAPAGKFWDTLQYPGSGPALDSGGVASWEDINGDGVPELMIWQKTPSDSLFSECADCPSLYTEKLFTLRANGFEPEDERVVPTPYATFQRFIRRLTDGRRAEARSLVARPGMVDSALALGWGSDRAASAWRLEYAEPGATWPRWLVMRQPRAKGRRSYAVRFARPKGGWVISGWTRERYFGPDSTIRDLYDAAGADTVRGAPPRRAGERPTTKRPAGREKP